MALVTVTLPPYILAAEWDGVLKPGATMLIAAPGMATPLEVPLAPAAPLPRVRVGVWEWTG
jgi:hypothetical protein